MMMGVTGRWSPNERERSRGAGTLVVVVCYFGFEFGEGLGFDVEDLFGIGTHIRVPFG